jgi:WxcM-like, C-terminal
MSGSFDVILDDGTHKQRYHLNRSYYGLYVCPMIWRELDNFSSGSVCLALASNKYDETDYYRNYEEFLNALGQTKA